MFTTVSNKSVHCEVKTLLGMLGFIYVGQNLLLFFPFFKRSRKCLSSPDKTHQATEYLHPVIFCNYEPYKHCINIAIPLGGTDCLSF